MKKENCDALFVLADVTRPAIVTRAARSRIPAIYQTGVYVPLGGLASYSPQLEAIYRKVAQYVDRIFKGADPAELPVEQPLLVRRDAFYAEVSKDFFVIPATFHQMHAHGFGGQVVLGCRSAA